MNAVKVLSTPLHSAARQQDITMVTLLLEFGADASLTDNDGMTAREVVPSATSKIRQFLLHWKVSEKSGSTILVLQ